MKIEKSLIVAESQKFSSFFYFVQSEIELHLSITRRPNFMQNFPLVSYIEVIIGFNFGVCCLYVFTSQR